MLLLILFVAIIGKLFGCGLAALGSGMDWVRSLRVGCGMISRGEVGLIVTAMGANTGIFGQSEIAVMVAVVLLTTLITPIALRGAFQLKSQQDVEEGLGRARTESHAHPAMRLRPCRTPKSRPRDSPPSDASFRMTHSRQNGLLAFDQNTSAREVE